MFSVCSIYVFSMLRVGHILILDLVVNLFKHSLPGMILLCLATPLITPKVLFHKILLIGIRLKFCLVGLIVIAVSFYDGICHLK